LLSSLFSPDIIFWIPAIAISLTIHEFSHGYAAYLLGDDTARAMGRLTLNPLRHLDPVGFLSLLFFHFGWAKPVPVNPRNFRSTDEKTGMLLTAVAGPLSNILFCFVCVGAMILLPVKLLYSVPWVYRLLDYMILINASLAFFNLIPVPPLDGSKVLFGLLPYRFYYAMQAVEQYGFIILLFLLVSRIPAMIISPLANGLISSFFKFFALFG
jgi:Zn-dependent protease